MATNLREFFSSISENIELGEDFDINQIPEVELPEQFNNNFHQNFLTPLSAKNNDTIRNHFKGQYLSTVDSRLKASFLANGGTEELFNELKSEQPDSMKLIDVVTAKMGELISKPNATSSNKEHEAYRTQTAKQIAELMDGNAKWEEKFKNAISENNSEWSNKLKNSMITSKLNAKSFNDSIGKEDAVYLTMKRVNDSPYILGLDENLQEKVYDRDNPDMEAIVDGKNIGWDYVLDKSSYEYTKKNDQQQAPAPKVVVAPAQTTISDEDGRYVVGHPNYGK